MMNGYQHLDLDERRQIYQLAATGRSVHEIAASLQRHRSTIYRELNRNRHLDDEPMFRGYFPTAAQTMADRRRVRGGKISLLAIDLDGDAMLASPVVCISPWPTQLANALPKSVIVAALVIGKATF